MTKRMLSLLAALCVLCGSGLTAYASEEGSDPPGSPDIVISYDDIREEPDAETIYAQEVRMEDMGSSRTIYKTYEVPPDYDPAALVEPAFEDAGFSFVHSDIYKKTLESTFETRLVSETRQYETDTQDKAKILAGIPLLLDYEENSFAGQLQMDSGTLTTVATGYSSYQYIVTSTQPYVPLDRNDPVYVDKARTENGVDMKLTDVEWSANSSTIVGNSLVPTSYKGDAVYQGVATGYSANGYMTTVSYVGEIKKEIPGNILYTIVYSGVEIPPPEEPKQVPVAPIAAGTGVTLGGGAFAVFFFFRKKNAKIYNMQNGQYVLVDKQRVKTDNPRIDLAQSKYKAVTNAYMIVLDSILARKIFGRTITIEGGGAPLTHRVQGSGGEYQFEVTI